MQPKIEIIGDANKCLPYLKWAKNQWTLREGSWQKQLDTCIIYFKRNVDCGYILFQTFGTKGLVTNPHSATNLQFVLDATKDPLWIMDRDGWPPLEPTNPDQDKEIQVGNYYVLDKDDNAYSIKVPHHNLATDVGSSVKGYTQYAWTTNVSMEDVSTCYSEYVYSEGEPVFAGTMAPPGAAFKYGLIVGIGVKDNVLHLAQLSGIPKNYGYWRIEKDGTVLGTFFGTLAQATKKGAASLVWKNETDSMWWVEFFTCDNGLDTDLVQNLNIYRRVKVGRGATQWFYNSQLNSWDTRDSFLDTTLSFNGLTSRSLFGLKVKDYLWNTKAVVCTHEATFTGGSVNVVETGLPVMIEPIATINISQSADWPADNSYILIQMTKPECVSVSIDSTVPNVSLVEIEKDKEYRYVLSNKCVINQNAKTVSGVTTVTDSTGVTRSLTSGYTTKAANWELYSETSNPHTLKGLCSGSIYYEQSGYFLTEIYTSSCCASWDGQPYAIGGNTAATCYGGSGLTSTDVTLASNKQRLNHTPGEWDRYMGEYYVGETRVVPNIILEAPWPFCTYYQQYPLGYYWSAYNVIVLRRVYEWRCI